MSRCRLPTLKLLTIAILAVLPVLSAYAGPQSQDHRGRNSQRDGSRDGRQESRGEQEASSLSDAVRRVERDTRGEVLSAERVQYDGRDMHRVKVVDDQGRVRVFMQDPRREDAESDAESSRGERGSRRRPPPARDDDD
jgi:hypothetical protein